MSDEARLGVRQVWSVGPTMDAFSAAAGEFTAVLTSHALGAQRRHDLELIFEEIVTNVIRHGGLGSGTRIDVSFEAAGDGAVLTFEDRGPAFDPTAHAVKPIAESIEEASIGGYGLLLVRKAASRIDYARTPDQRNVLTVWVGDHASDASGARAE